MSRISPATMTAAIFAILVGLVGAYSVRQYLSGTGPVEAVAAELPKTEMVFVPIAARDMVIGQTLTLSDISIERIEKSKFGNSKYVGMSFMTDTKQMVGKQLQVQIEKGGVFLPEVFYPEGMGPSVTRLLTPGHRAVTIPIKNVGAVEGFASPGTMVDVLFRSLPNEDRPEVTLTLLESVEVLAVDRNVLPGQLPNGAAGRPATVTLGVSPEQAKALKAVEDRGELSLVLRHPDDDRTLVSAGLNSSDQVTIDQLIGGKPIQRKASIEIYNGAQRNEFTFNESVKDGQGDLNRISTPIRSETTVAAVSLSKEEAKLERRKKKDASKKLTASNSGVADSARKQ